MTLTTERLDKIEEWLDMHPSGSLPMMEPEAIRALIAAAREWDALKAEVECLTKECDGRGEVFKRQQRRELGLSAHNAALRDELLKASDILSGLACNSLGAERLLAISETRRCIGETLAATPAQSLDTLKAGVRRATISEWERKALDAINIPLFSDARNSDGKLVPLWCVIAARSAIRALQEAEDGK